LDDADFESHLADLLPTTDSTWDMHKLARLIEQFAPLDRQLVLLYLEGISAAEIADITGLSAGNVSTRIHRIKKILARQFHGEDQ